jgi:two-component system, response regulator
MVDAIEAPEILLIEDNPTDAELCIRALKKQNFANRLLWVKDGAEAIDAVFGTGSFADRKTNHIPKVVLLDLRLPKIDGIEVLRRVKADPCARLIPVVVLTSSKESRDVSEAYALGVNSFVTKPVEFDSFVEVISKLGFYWLIINKPPEPIRQS